MRADGAQILERRIGEQFCETGFGLSLGHVRPKQKTGRAIAARDVNIRVGMQHRLDLMSPSAPGTMPAAMLFPPAAAIMSATPPLPVVCPGACQTPARSSRKTFGRDAGCAAMASVTRFRCDS